MATKIRFIIIILVIIVNTMYGKYIYRVAILTNFSTKYWYVRHNQTQDSLDFEKYADFVYRFKVNGNYQDYRIYEKKKLLRTFEYNDEFISDEDKKWVIKDDFFCLMCFPDNPKMNILKFNSDTIIIQDKNKYDGNIKLLTPVPRYVISKYRIGKKLKEQ